MESRWLFVSSFNKGRNWDFNSILNRVWLAKELEMNSFKFLKLKEFKILPNFEGIQVKLMQSLIGH
ncbi:hypothetical protein HanPI659440_Chr04g0148701 [Helianthus annuus]|nr:hypothetical protein HanPI659440_Chr04g0148701 [Helianthus annuus]